MTNRTYNFAGRNIETSAVSANGLISLMAGYFSKRPTRSLRRSRRFGSSRAKYYFAHNS